MQVSLSSWIPTRIISDWIKRKLPGLLHIVCCLTSIGKWISFHLRPPQGNLKIDRRSIKASIEVEIGKLNEPMQQLGGHSQDSLYQEIPSLEAFQCLLQAILTIPYISKKMTTLSRWGPHRLGQPNWLASPTTLEAHGTIHYNTAALRVSKSFPMS